MGRHFGQSIIKDVLQMRNEGRTHREIGDCFGLTTKQIKQLLERYRKNQRKLLAGVPLRPKGRPRRTCQTHEEKLLCENKQLKMENELLRAFRHATGRR